jgi:hypothetical protein
LKRHILENIKETSAQSGYDKARSFHKNLFQKFGEKEGIMTMIVNDILDFLFASSDNNRINQFYIFQNCTDLIEFVRTSFEYNLYSYCMKTLKQDTFSLGISHQHLTF